MNANENLRDAARALLRARVDMAVGRHNPTVEARAWDTFALALDAAEDEALASACGCFACVGNKPAHPGTWLTVGMTRMIVCSECGNKRCPHSTDHRNECTASNEPEQAGSRYGGLPSGDPS